MLDQAMARGTLWGGDDLREYVNRLGQNLARASGSRQEFTFVVVYDPEINAQAFPGGYVTVNSGAISFAESEAELSAVLAHEIAHVNACDCEDSGKKNAVGFLALVPALALAGPVGIALTAGTGIMAPVTRAHSRRSAERRADRLAAQYLVQAGYDPHAVLTMLTRVEQQDLEGGDTRSLLATHPRTRDRQKGAERFVVQLPPPEKLPHDDTEFRRMQKQVRDYDELYSRAFHTRLPGKEPVLPPLSDRHRP